MTDSNKVSLIVTIDRVRGADAQPVAFPRTRQRQPVKERRIIADDWVGDDGNGCSVFGHDMI